jgi:hypothetical protein
MPFKSESQRRLFWAKVGRGEISAATVKHWEDVTPKGKKLPEHAKTAAFVDEVLNIFGEKRAAILPLIARLEYGPDVKRKIQEKEEAGRRVLHKIDRLLSFGEAPEQSFIQKMEES